MKLLLDTHVWLWSILAPRNLSPAIQRQIVSPQNERYLSPVSVWEARHVVRKRRMKLDRPWSTWFEWALEQMPMQEAPFSFQVATETAQIQLPQPDFGDLAIAATASAYNLTLVTADEQLLRCSWLKTLAAC
jgi:PIN domain nuclease of toxin-antitoxin system